MNLKKYIRLKEENTEEISCAEENKERYQQLYAQVQANEAAIAAVKKPIKMCVGISTLFVIIAAIIIAVSFIFAPNCSNDILYKYSNVERKDSSYNELLNDVNYFNLQNAYQEDEVIILFYDIVSGDKLYYGFKVDLEVVLIDFVIVINDKFDYEFTILNAVERELSDYTLTYGKETSYSPTGYESFIYKGKININNETVFFEYTQIMALGDEAFLESIQSIVKVK